MSDRAKALLKLGAHYRCSGIADLFHFLMEPVRLFKFSFSRKLATLAKEERKIKANGKQPESDAFIVNEKMKALDEKRLIITQEQTKYRHELQVISTTVHPFNLSAKRQTSEQISNKLKDSVLSLRGVVTTCDMNDKKNALGKMERQIEPIAALTNLWWQWVDTDVTLSSVSTEFQDALKQYLLPAVYFKMQIRKSKSKKSLREIYQKVYQAAEKELMAHPLKSELTTEAWIHWATHMSHKYQRTTSAIEGRNGLLAGFNLCARGMTESQLESQTIINNYWIKRADGTTAVERCFNFKPENDLFEFIVKHMKELPLPRHHEKKQILPFIQGNVLATD